MADFQPHKLATALEDREPWVRIGAAAAAPWIAPAQAVELLTWRAIALGSEATVAEAATVAVALARAGGDPLPLVASLLRVGRSELDAALVGGVEWNDFVATRVRSGGLPKGAYAVLAPFWAAWSAGPQSLVNAITDFQRAEAAIYRLNRELTSNRISDRAMKAEIGASFGLALKALEARDIARASDLLIRVALTDLTYEIRAIARGTLAELGEAAAAPLLAVLSDANHGLDLPRPREELVADLSAGGDIVTPTEAFHFLAAEALAGFEDPVSVFAIASAAIHGEGEPQARAARVLAHMSADAGLPPLMWSALNLPSSQGRQTASALLERIVRNDPAFGLRHHHVGARELNPRALDWLGGLAQESGRDWTRDPEVGVGVVGSAIRSMPRIVGETATLYMSPPVSSRVLGFRQSINLLVDREPRQPAMRAQRQPEVGFPSACELGAVTPFTIRLKPDIDASGAEPFEVPFPEGGQQVELLVVLQAPAFEASPAYGVLRIPREGPSDTATFSLRARDLGEHAIDVKFLLGTETIGHCCVVTQVVAKAKEALASEPAAAISLQPVTEGALQLQSQAEAVLRAIRQPDGRLAWSAITANGKPTDLGRSPQPFNDAAISRWGVAQADLTKQVLAEDYSPANLEGALSGLSAVGSELFDQIAPDALRGFLDRLAYDALIVIESDADWAPWELLAADSAGPMLGQRFVLVRSPVITAPPTVAISTPVVHAEPINRALLVIGDEIDGPDSLPKRTFGKMARRADTLVTGAWGSLRQNVANKDILHFACHVRGDPLHISYGPSAGQRLFPAQAGQLGLKPGAVVFANACGSAATQWLLADLQSFARQFYLAGARPFIGTLGPVPEKDAVAFAALFYRHFAFSGLPAGQALRLARRQAAELIKTPIWLFYSLYGYASTTRRWSAT